MQSLQMGLAAWDVDDKTRRIHEAMDQLKKVLAT